MRLTHLLKNRVIIARLATTTGDRMAFSTVTAEMMNIQPTGNSASEIAEGVFGKSFRIYCDGGSDLQAGDRLRDQNGDYYTVMSDGVSRRTMGTMDYIIAVVQKTKK